MRLAKALNKGVADAYPDTITPERIVNALINWFDENDGREGPHAGSLFEDTDLTWNDALLYVTRHKENK